MKKKNIYFRSVLHYQKGLTLIEMTISILMVSVFLSFFVLVVELTNKYIGIANNQNNGSQGLLVDHHKLQMTMDLYADILSQPAISLSEINNIKQKVVGSLPPGCSYSPRIDWNLPVTDSTIAGDNWKLSSSGYALCLKSTSIPESRLEDLLSNSENANPGVYVLLSLPSEISKKSLPARRLFCRPNPFC